MVIPVKRNELLRSIVKTRYDKVFEHGYKAPYSTRAYAFANGMANMVNIVELLDTMDNQDLLRRLGYIEPWL